MLRVVLSIVGTVVAVSAYAAPDSSRSTTDADAAWVTPATAWVTPTRGQPVIEPTLPRLPGYADPAQRDGATAPVAADAPASLDATVAAAPAGREPARW